MPRFAILYMVCLLVLGVACKKIPPIRVPPQIPTLSNFDAQFTVSGTDMTIEGRIKTNSSALIFSTLATNPGVTTVILKNVPGTLDADASFAIGRAIRSNNLATVLPAGGFIASGGTDLFLAGTTRTISGPSVTLVSGLIAVHSWEASTTRDSDLPVSSTLHQPFLTYYS